MKRQYCSRLSKTENCQSGIFLAFAGDNGYGLVDYELYLPREWYRGLFQIRWVGCDATYGNDHAFLDGLKLPEGVWYFAAANAKEQVLPESPQMSYLETKRGRLRKHPILFTNPVSVREIAEYSSILWESVALAEGAKGSILAERKYMRCYKDENRSYVKPGPEIWLYLRKYADEEIKYFVSNASGRLAVQKLDRAATLRWPIEQCFEECKSDLGMGHYECRSYRSWNRHMLFVMIAHLFTIYIREI